MNAPGSHRTRLILAFTAVYLIWGSTYLAMRIAVATMPPLLMASMRMLSAGGILLGLALVTGAARPGRAEWQSAVWIGALLFLGGNGAVVWSAQHAPSGLVAVVVGSVPLWLVVLEAIRPEGNRPRPITWLGVAVGLAGIALLVGPGRMQGGIDTDLAVAVSGRVKRNHLKGQVGSGGPNLRLSTVNGGITLNVD